MLWVLSDVVTVLVVVVDGIVCPSLVAPSVESACAHGEHKTAAVVKVKM